MNNHLKALQGKRGVVLGIANHNSIAYGCALAFRKMGAELALTFLNEKAKPYVEPIAKELEAPIFLPCDLAKEGELESVFKTIEQQWGSLDFALHCVAFAPKHDLHGRVTDCSREGFLQAMDISCHSFLRTAKLAEPLMTNGGTLFTMSFYGSTRVVKHYNMMGPVKAALESSVRYLAYELGSKGIRVHAISPGPLSTRAASGLKDFDTMLADAVEKAPSHQLVSIHDIGAATAALATDAARLITGDTLYIDAGYHIMA